MIPNRFTPRPPLKADSTPRLWVQDELPEGQDEAIDFGTGTSYSVSDEPWEGNIVRFPMGFAIPPKQAQPTDDGQLAAFKCDCRMCTDIRNKGAGQAALEALRESLS